MAFKDNSAELKLIDIALIEPDPAHPRRHCDEVGLKGLANSIQSKGLIHPVLVRPADAAGRYRLIVGERRWRAAQLAGETQLPALVRACDGDEALEIQVFENLGLGLRAPLEPREMAGAIQTIAERFESREAAAEHFGRNPTWLNQATAAANLSPKVTALLDSGKIASTSTAIQLERLAQKNVAKADTLIDQVEQLPEGEKLSKTVVDRALSEEGLRRSKKKPAVEEAEAPVVTTPAWESPEPVAATTTAVSAPVAAPTPQPSASRRVHPSKIRLVAEILGLADGDEEEVLSRLVDEFLAMQGDAGSAA
ncbi:ParB/RepB/Spo0J family partition protein [Quatrionicoccus australiensis]|uniref:ParB/RepB/Spo0J family partition protein n=1 Tax=Quatrionicoccus australiensis TaxID=138118 RepID=UPI001CFB2140|nr:ParB/RepB/Spo0J family partition protein [Quatrionicoccus australiensis]MCB4361893.1 ParB/RepB/Spo0J family partition protein [Quatrionicoccus australiensis]